MGHGGTVVRTSDSHIQRNLCSKPLAAVSKVGQFRSIHIASVHSAV